MDHFKFIVELVQALLTERGSGSVRKFQVHHSTDKNVKRILERHFPERIPPTENKARPTKRCSVCYKNNRRKETLFWCPDVKQPYVLKKVLRHFTPS